VSFLLEVNGVKKVKLFSILVIVLSIVALGIFMGKQVFVFLETKTAPQGAKQPESDSILGTAEAAPAQGATRVLYAANAEGSSSATGSSAPVAVPYSAPAGVNAGSVNGSPATENAGSMSKVGPADQLVAFANGNGINVREEPNLTCKKVMKVANGTRGAVVERKDGWTKVKWDFNRKSGWTRDDLLVVGPRDVLPGLSADVASGTASAAAILNVKVQKALAAARKISVAIAKPAPPSETVKGFASGSHLPGEGTICSDPYAKIRSSPNVKSAILGKIPKGVVVKIKSSKRVGKFHWFEIVFNQGKKEGWTREDNLQFQ